MTEKAETPALAQATEQLREEIRDVARDLGILDAAGRLLPLDSVTLMDFVIELETRMSIEIPTAQITTDRFKTLESVAAVVAQLRG